MLTARLARSFDLLERPIQMGNTISWTSSWLITTSEIHSCYIRLTLRFVLQATFTFRTKIPLVYPATTGPILNPRVCQCPYRRQSGKAANPLPAFLFPQ